jgi:hypothetical protein
MAAKKLLFSTGRWIRRLLLVINAAIWVGFFAVFFWNVPLIRYAMAVFALCAIALTSLNYYYLIRPDWERRRLIHEGRCIHCGYDLRQSPGRCPECGASVQEWRHSSFGSRSTRALRKALRQGKG